MSRDNNSKGIVLILIAMSLFAIQDSLIKFIFEKSALYEIFFGRYLIAATVLFIYLSFKRQLVKTNTIDFSEKPLNSSGSYFVGHANYDDFSNKYDVGRNEVGAEFSQYELDSYSKPEERTQFDSKVEESIYRAKKHLLKTKGDY